MPMTSRLGMDRSYSPSPAGTAFRYPVSTISEHMSVKSRDFRSE